MIITRVDVLHTKTSLKNGHWRPILCRVFTDKGIYGDGEAALAYGEAQLAAFGMIQNFAKLIIGMDPLDTEVIWDKLYRTTFWGQNGGPVIFSGISAIDMALWDIKGKYFNVPIYKLLGGKKRSLLRTYASQLQFGWAPQIIPCITDEDYANAAKRAVSEGYDAIKIDFFMFRPNSDGEFTNPNNSGIFTSEDRMGMISPSILKVLESRCAAVREAIGDGIDIIIENHSFTDSLSAIQLANIMKKYVIFYFEEPNTPTPHLSKFVHQETGLPIAAGERIYTRWQYADYFVNNAIQIIQPDIGTCGGFTETKKVCDMAYTYDVGVQIHACGSPLSTSAAMQMEAVIPNFVIHEHHIYSRAPQNIELCKYDYQPESGKFRVPELPGLGNEISDIAYKEADIASVS